jgi:hypothetical protein
MTTDSSWLMLVMEIFDCSRLARLCIVPLGCCGAMPGEQPGQGGGKNCCGESSAMTTSHCLMIFMIGIFNCSRLARCQDADEISREQSAISVKVEAMSIKNYQLSQQSKESINMKESTDHTQILRWDR